MDSILTLIFIWIAISLLNYFSKKLKKVEKPVSVPTPTPPVREKSEIPPFLREIFKIPEEQIPTDAPPTITAEMDSKESDYSIERETAEAFKKRKVREEKVLTSEPTLRTEQLSTVPVASVAKPEITRIAKKFESLKEAVIWKEILDRPLSLRAFGHRWRM